jgi:hypothetical protein
LVAGDVTDLVAGARVHDGQRFHLRVEVNATLETVVKFRVVKAAKDAVLGAK